VVNAQVVTDKLQSPQKTESTGINYVELLLKRKEPEE
jgi:hypothetical protein